MKKHIVIIGGGASGYFCAANIDADRFSITIIEKSNKTLSKVSISGGGRCNVTHNHDSISVMAKQYPRGDKLTKKTFHYFFVKDTLQWFKDRGVNIVAEEDGRMFPVSNTSESIIDCLENAVIQKEVVVKKHHEVSQLTYSRENQKYTIEFKQQKAILADFVVIATGGYPKISHWEWLQSLNLKIISPQPSLFTFNLKKHPICELMGISLEEVSIKVMQTKLQQDGPLLITHWGFSGPAILKLSAWGANILAQKNWNFDIQINFLGNTKEEEIRNVLNSYRNYHGKQLIINRNPFNLPARLWQFLIATVGIDKDMQWGNLPAKLQNLLIIQLHHHPFSIQGKTTFKEEFVTAGGIDVSEIDSNTCMTKNFQNLYIVGEALNVDGITGGYNFQHAWTSGFIAAQAINKTL